MRGNKLKGNLFDFHLLIVELHYVAIFEMLNLYDIANDHNSFLSFITLLTRLSTDKELIQIKRVYHNHKIWIDIR